MHFSYVDVCAILRNDRINDAAVKTPVTKETEEWVMADPRGFQEDTTF